MYSNGLGICAYFNGRKTNASAESLNSKIKCFRAQVKGVRDIPFHVSFSNSFGLATTVHTPQGLSVAPRNNQNCFAF